MRITPLCIPCLLSRVFYEIAGADDEKKAEIMHECTRLFGEIFDPGANSAGLATHIHAKAYSLLGDPDPYRKAKEESNRVALELLPKAENLVKRSPNPLRTAMLVSIAGNVLDFGNMGSMGSARELVEQFDSLVCEDLAVDDTPSLIRHIRKPSTREVLYFADNSGEIIFDTLVIRELKRLGKRVVLVVKGEPILTDATMADVREHGLEKEVDGVLTTGSFAVGVDLGRIPKELRGRLKKADLIIAKGMGNYESFSDSGYGPIAYLLRTKCAPVAASLGVKENINVVRFLKNP